MEYIKHTTDFYIAEETAVSLGKFDGLHRGHGYLMERLERKKKAGQKAVVFTFDIPPRQRMDPGRPSKALMTNIEKMHLFARRNIDYLIECPFTAEIMQMSPEDFVDWIVERLHIRAFVVGTDFHFGYQRRGDYRLLQKLAGVYGYDVEVVDKIRENGRDISSSYVREEILAGRIEKANALLGYAYFVQGVVVHGKEIGRTLKIPTANLTPEPKKLLPPYGVYVTKTTVDGQAYGGITNVGCKPTIPGQNPIGVETHLFGFDGQLYGREIKVEFLARVREEMRFASLDALKRQMQQDIAFGQKYWQTAIL